IGPRSTHLDRAREAPPAILQNPYRGLHSFREEDAPFFFGREKIIDRLAAETALTRSVLLTGASGSGKSSILQAGLFPRLRRSSHDSWELLSIVPGISPFRSLASALLTRLSPDLSETARLHEVKALAETLRTTESGICDAVNRLMEKQLGTT